VRTLGGEIVWVLGKDDLHWGGGASRVVAIE